MARAPKKQRAKSRKPAPRQAPAASSTTTSGRSYYLYALPAVLLALVVFGQTLAFDFVNWDDELNVLENRGVTTFDLRAIWTQTVIGNYNPLPITTFAVEHALVGLDATLYHATNVALHLANVVLVYLLGRRLRLDAVPAGLLAVLFAVHPMRVESVAWVTERKDVLFAAFYFGALLLYERRRQAGAPGSWHWGIGALFALALVSKIQAVSLPLTMLCFDYLRGGRLTLRDVLAKWPYFAMSLAVGLLGIYFLGRDGSLDDATDYTFVGRLAVGAYAYVVYLVKSVLPYEMSPLYPYPAELPWQAYASFVGVAAAAGSVLVGYLRGWRAWTFGLALFTVNVVFMLQVLGAGQGYLADRFTYVGYLGLFWLVAYGVQALTRARPGLAVPVRVGVGVYVLVLAVVAFRQTKIWTDGGTLWTHVAALYPEAGTAHGNLGQFLRKQERIDEALAAYARAIAADPTSGTYLNSRGKLLFDRGDAQGALADYSLGLERSPELAELHINRGAAYAQLGQYNDAERDLKAGLALEPDNFNGLLNLSLLLYTTQRYDEALALYDQMLDLRPERLDLLQERGSLKVSAGRREEGIADVREAIRREADVGKRARYQGVLDQLEGR